MTTEKITTINCPKCETEIIYIPPDHGYVVIDEVRYLVPQALCELLQQVSEERDKLREKIGKKDEEIAALKEMAAALMEEGQDAAYINNHNAEVSSQVIAVLKEKAKEDEKEIKRLKMSLLL